MSRAGRARRIAAAAAFGGGGITFLGALGVGVVAAEARLARRWIGQPFGVSGPDAGGLYGAGPGDPIQLAILGDSSADGLGADRAEETPGAIVASGLAAVSGRPVHLTNVAVVGAESSGLRQQVTSLLEKVPHLDVAVILVGANDVTHRIKPAAAVRELAAAVTRLRDVGTEVVVGTCPDLGTIEPVAQPLRSIARRWSRELAAAQTIAVVEAGARSVSLGDILGREFAAEPRVLFSSDRFHPSAAGYARMAATILPSVCAAAGYWPDGGAERRPETRRGEGIVPVAQAAVAAADDPGTEVAATEVAGAQRGQFGRWAQVLRRRRQPMPAVGAPRPDGGDPMPDVGAPRPGGGEVATEEDHDGAADDETSVVRPQAPA